MIAGAVIIFLGFAWLLSGAGQSSGDLRYSAPYTPPGGNRVLDSFDIDCVDGRAVDDSGPGYHWACQEELGDAEGTENIKAFVFPVLAVGMILGGSWMTFAVTRDAVQGHG